MEKTKTFEQLVVWQSAHAFTLKIYKETEAFPKTEMFGLTSQFRRASVSIAANIAEGYKRLGKPDKLRFFNISQGSLEECRYYLILARDLTYFNLETFNSLSEVLNQTSTLLNAYCLAISNSQKNLVL